jgi:fumarylacetoacetase
MNVVGDTHGPAPGAAGPRGTWVPIPEGCGFGIANLPYGIFSRRGELPRVGVAIGEYVLDLADAARAGLLVDRRWFAAGTLNAFMTAGRGVWLPTRERIALLLSDETYRAETERHLIRRDEVELHMPVGVSDYVDFFSSRDHAANMGSILRPKADPLLPNWTHMPVAYHGRAGTVVASGTPIVRPCGQRLPSGPGEAAPEGESESGPTPTFGPTLRLDIEAEVGFFVGTPSALSRPVPTTAFRDHVFGFVLVNDWSARDIQAWEYQPLGPFLGKSFATSISPWVIPVDALEGARVSQPAQDPAPLPYLQCPEPWGLDVVLEIELNGHVVSRPPYADMYWTPPQQLAHVTANGAALRTGDLMASGTVSGSKRDQRGSLIELSWNGAEPVSLPDGTQRSFLEDGDTVTIRATAPAAGHLSEASGERISFGEVTGTIHPPRPASA